MLHQALLLVFIFIVSQRKARIKAASKSSFHLIISSDIIKDATLFPFEIFYVTPSASFEYRQSIDLTLQSSTHFEYYYLKLKRSSPLTFLYLSYMFYFH